LVIPDFVTMVTRRISRDPAKMVLIVVVFVLAATSYVTSGARCYPKNLTAPSVISPSGVEKASNVDFGSSHVTDVPVEDFAEAPMIEASSFETPTRESNRVDAPTTESSGADVGSSTNQKEDNEGSVAQTRSSSAEQTGNSTFMRGSEHPTLGKIISSGKCVTGDPETFVTREQIDWVWKNTLQNNLPQYYNLIFDQIVNNKGKLQYCVRWDTDKTLEKATASKFEAMLSRQMNLWNQWLVGYECWPFDMIDIEIVAFAVKDKSIMDWSDDSLGTIYEGILDDEGSPKCPDECYKRQDGNSDSSSCTTKTFDMSLWPSTMAGVNAIGMGSDWGQRVEVNDMLATMGQEYMMVLLHEIGHGFGLHDLYVAQNKPPDYPVSVMDSDHKLTPGDGWLLRVALENIKSRYSFAG
ncbi:Neutral zinc metallopeptidase, partial [Phytophthora megakarya]